MLNSYQYVQVSLVLRSQNLTQSPKYGIPAAGVFGLPWVQKTNQDVMLIFSLPLTFPLQKFLQLSNDPKVHLAFVF